MVVTKAEQKVVLTVVNSAAERAERSAVLKVDLSAESTDKSSVGLKAVERVVSMVDLSAF